MLRENKKIVLGFAGETFTVICSDRHKMVCTCVYTCTVRFWIKIFGARWSLSNHLITLLPISIAYLSKDGYRVLDCHQVGDNTLSGHIYCLTFSFFFFNFFFLFQFQYSISHLFDFQNILVVKNQIVIPFNCIKV